MKELKGLETHEFYSRFFVETALLKQEQMNVSGDEAKRFMGLGETFYKFYNDLAAHPHDKQKQKDFMGWFHANLIQQLGYQNLEPRIYETTGKKGIVARGTIKLVDNEELWIVEGHGGHSFNEEDPFEITPNCSSVHLLGEEFEVDKTKSYRKIFDELFSDENENAGWAMYLAGEKMYLLESEKWLDKGTFIKIDWPEVFNNKANDTFKAILGLFGARGFKVENGEIPHNLLAETAHREAHGVTKSLKYSVRDALEIIVNEVLESHKRNPSQYIDKLIKSKPEDLAKDLSGQGLRYLYRLLFLFYVEARGRESEILPVKSPAYQLGYSLENLRNLELVNKTSIKNGTFIQQTLDRTFNLMFSGYNINDHAEFDENVEEDEEFVDEAIYSAGFECPKVGALLFNSKYTPVFDEVELSDAVMQKVIQKLSLAESGKGKKTKTQRISYANLGLNQLGAVYEGLLSLKAVITDREYYTVVLGTRDEEFLIPTEDRVKFKGKIKLDSNGNEILHNKGKFLFRTMGYERKYSASFYTDESLTQSLVKETINEYFKNNKKPKVKDISKMKVLEPAMGSGAFLNEVANQLAVYLAKAYKRELKEYKNTSMKELNDIAKEYIMRNCLYGVDLNPMAAELAKVSLWLNCIRKDSKSAFHDFKIRHGNSLVGAFVNQKTVWNTKIHHFLAPLPEMVDTYIEACELGSKKNSFFSPSELSKLNLIKESYKNVKNYDGQLEKISKILDEYYKIHTEKRIRFQNMLKDTQLSESEISKRYQDYINNNAEFNKLKIIMDYWCSLWFWEPSNINLYPTIDEFINNIEEVINLDIDEYSDIILKIEKNNNLSNIMISKNIIKSVPFFHYDLEFPEVFNNGGFDLVVGNPPWAKLSWSDSDFFSDINPELQIKKLKPKQKNEVFTKLMNKNGIREYYQNSIILANGIRQYLTYSKCYPFSDRSERNTYKYFWQRSHLLSRKSGVYGLIKQGGITSDKGMEDMRPTYYKELTQLFTFVNEKNLFEADHNVKFVMSVFRKGKDKVQFNYIDSLYHPITIDRCMKASIFDQYPGKKDNVGKFNLQGHPDRIISYNEKKLKDLTHLTDLSENEYLLMPLPSVYGNPEFKVIKKAIDANMHLGDNQFYWTKLCDENAAQKNGFIDIWAKQTKKLSTAVLTGPNIYVGTPFYKTPNPSCKNNSDYSAVDLNEISADYFPSTKYKLTKKGCTADLYKSPEINKFRIIARKQVSVTGSRTLSSAIYPPGVVHIDGAVSMCFSHDKETLYIQGLCNSIIYDYYSRSLSTGNLNKSFWEMLPLFNSEILENEILLRTLRLNCLSNHYSELWDAIWTNKMKSSPSLKHYKLPIANNKLNSVWDWNSPIRGHLEREQTLCEVDALVAMIIGFSKNDLLKLYRSQFGALQKKFKDLPGQVEEDSFPRAKIMEEAYDMFLDHFGVTEEQVVAGYFQEEQKAEAA